MRYARLALGLSLVLALFALVAGPAAASPGAGDKAPDFRLGNVSGNGTIQLSNYTNKPTLLVFWVSWCPHCEDEAPIVNSVYNDLKAKGLNVVGVSADEDIADARKFVKEYKVTYPNGFAGTKEGMTVIDKYGLDGVPALYVIDKTGVIKAVFMGETDADTIKAEFAKLGVK